MKGSYIPEEMAVEGRIDEIVRHTLCLAIDAGYPEAEAVALSSDLRDVIEFGWASLPSPTWANFGNPRKNALSISCNGAFVDDSISGFAETIAETMALTKAGAGTSMYVGAIRPHGSPISVGGNADGPIPFVKQIDNVMGWITQGLRRGACAITMDVDHADIEKFVHIGAEDSDIQNVFTSVSVSNDFVRRLKDGDAAARGTWAKVLASRIEKGYPFIFFEDNVNDGRPEWYKDGDGDRIYASNLCSEIALPSSPGETFVCNLSSMNLLKYEEWKDTNAVATMIAFMDLVQGEYIRQTEGRYGFDRAHAFARRHRALGLGALGWHDLLQSRMIPFDSYEAMSLNNEIFSTIRRQADAETRSLARRFGEAPVCRGYGVRNATLMAIAPTTSSAFILGGVSQSIEPKNSNYYVRNLHHGEFTYRNPFLTGALAAHGRNDPETWSSILRAGGSVQHLSFLTDREREVFRTWGEIPQMAIVNQAAQRQRYVDQSQSLNLMIPAGTPVKEINALLLAGHEKGIKTFYYQRSTNTAQEFSRSLMSCAACES